MTEDASNEKPLPEDVQHWPTDPATLLGVSSDASRRDVKRAYTRLIKKYKPEHAPEEFRRLRSAFEELDQQLEWREIYQLRRRDSSDDDVETPIASVVDDELGDTTIQRVDDIGKQSDAADDSPSRQKSARGAGEASSDQLWQQALDGGDLTAVYNGLLRWSRQRLPSEVDYARLYWLQTLVAKLDPERDPCQWLIEGLQKHGSSGRLLEMLDVEVRRRDGQVPQFLEEGVLNLQFSAGMLVSLADLRWYAARRQNRIDVIIQDFDLLRRRFLDEADEWLRLLSIALHHVALTHTPGFINQVREELSQVTSATSQDWIWDSVEAALRLHDAWLNTPVELQRQPYVRPILKEIVQLIEATWESSVAEARIPVLNFCLLMSDTPKTRLNELQRLDQSRPLVLRLCTLLDQQLAMKGLHRSSELTPGLNEELQRFIRKHFVRSQSHDFYEVVLDFCLQEAVTPHDIAAALDRFAVAVPDQYYETAEQITKNLALHCVVQAHRLLW